MGRNDIDITVQKFRSESKLDNSEIETDTMRVLKRVSIFRTIPENLAFASVGLSNISNWLSSSICPPLFLEKKYASIEA